MAAFTPQDLSEIDALWRQCDPDHVWCGWAHPGASAEEVWIFRERANWRRFVLRKSRNSFRLYDEKGRSVARGHSLSELLKRIDAMPGLNDPLV